MKKFIVYLLVIILTVSLGFAVFYLVRDNEVISISSASVYKDVGDTFTLDINHINKKASTEITITSSNEDIVSGKYDAKSGLYTAEAKAGGVARINVRTTNAKFRNLWCDVIVGDGSVESPFYISTAEQLSAIGMGAQKTITNEEGIIERVDGVFLGSGKFDRYTSDACYKLISNIDASNVNEGYWVPLRHFNGRFDGNGLTISNIYIDRDGYLDKLGDSADNLFSVNNVGIFETIGKDGVVYNLKIDNFMAVGDDYKTFGIITAENKGVIERVEIKNAYTSIITTVFGGIAGKNFTDEKLIEKTDSQGNSIEAYERTVARIDRCSVNLIHGQRKGIDGTTFIVGSTGIIGGLVGINDGGTIAYSFVKGEVFFGDDTNSAITYGGLVGINKTKSDLYFDSKYIEDCEYQGGNIKDCYSDIKPTFSIDPSAHSSFAGAVAIHSDYQRDLYEDKDYKVNSYLIGIYYNKEKLNYHQVGVTKNFSGVSKFTLDSNEVSFADTPTIIMGLTSEEMTNPTNFVSHTTKAVEFNDDGTSQGIIEKNVLWLFDSVWVIDEDVNDGMPYLNYQLIYIPDDFETVGTPIVPSTLNGYYYVLEINYPVSILSGIDGTLRIKENEYYQLIYSPTGIDLVWTSSNTDVVDVDSNGRLKGNSAGVATVTATTKTGSYDTITVIVEKIPYIIDVPSQIPMYIGDTIKISDIVSISPNPNKGTPDTSDDDEVIYSIVTEDNKYSDIASVVDGTLSATKAGEAYLTIKVADTFVRSKIVIGVRPSTTLTASPRTVAGYFNTMTKTGKIEIINSDSADLTYTYKFKSGSQVVNLNFGSGTNKKYLNYEVVATGNAVVTVSITNTGYTGSLDIYFNIKSETEVDLTLSSATITGYYEDMTKTGSVTIKNSANASLSYTASSNNTSVVSVKSVTGNSMNYEIKGVGNATITIEVDSNGYVGATCVNFQISKKSSTGSGDGIQYVDLNYTSFTLYVGDSLTLIASGNYETLKWTSSNSAVAIVSSGKVTAKSAGTTTIKATANNGAVAECLITVKSSSSSGISISVTPTTKTIFQGESFTLTASGNYSAVTWSTSNSGIASISANGSSCKVVASSSSLGSVTITASAKDSNGNVKASATSYITVTERPATITLSINHTVVNKGTNVVVTAALNKTGTVTWNSTTSDSYETKNGNTLTINTSSISTGTYTVTATYGSATAQVTFEVQDPTAYPTGGYIYTLAHLNSMRYNLNRNYILAADINVGDWIPVGTPSSPFTGDLSNLGSYKIQGLTTSGSTYAGLFGYIKDASIRGIEIKDSTITGTTYAGSIAGYAINSTLSYCVSTDVKVTTTGSKGMAGGIVGQANNSLVSNCTSSSVISSTGGGYAGGIVGYTNSTVSGSLVTSTVTTSTSSSNYAGGVAGYSTYKISSSTVRSSTITGYYAGGIAGTLNRGDTIKLYFSDHKSGYRWSDVSEYNFGGGTSVEKVAVASSTTVKGKMIGGLFGVLQSGLVKNCYTRATLNGVSSDSYKGGFACDINSTGFKNGGGSGTAGVIQYCYASVKFSGSGNDYAITRSAVHNYALVDTTRSAGFVMNYLFDDGTDGSAIYSYGNTGLFSSDKVKAKKSSSDMKKSSTYTDKGFSTSVWNLGSSYPTLKNEL